MFKESKETKEIERKNLYEKASEYKRELLPQLQEISEKLQKEGFSLDEQVRIKTEEFRDIFGKKIILADQKLVEKLERKFVQDEHKNIGELLEIVKTIAFNNFWFKERMVSLRTSKFDDYLNGIDEVIFDRQTHQPLAAVDTTTNIKEKTEEIIDKIKRGSQIKYGFYLTEGIKKGSLNDLPTFIISLKTEELLDFAQKIIEHFRGGKVEKIHFQIEKEILESLKRQAEEFQKIAEPKMKHSYEIAGQIFDDLLKSEDKSYGKDSSY